MNSQPDKSSEAATAAAPAGSRLDSYVDRYATRTNGLSASEVRSLFSVASRPEVVSFAGGMPNISDLPLDVIGSIMHDVVAQRGQMALQYSSGQGEPELREQICEVMRPAGISAHPDDITVTVGSQQALDLITRTFVDPGDVVLAEAPSYVTALGTFRAYQANVVHVEMDDHGLVPQRLREAITSVHAAGRRIKFLYTIPSYHNPAGVTLTPGRRREVLEICREHDVLIIEDDPYGLLGFDGDVPRAIRADDAERVIYVGSFSKTFAPGMRVGWALAPHAVREKLVLAAENSVLCPPAFNQLAVSRYLAVHDWKGQIKTFGETYRQRCEAMLAALSDLMPAGAHWTKPAGGFYVWLTLPGDIDTKAMLPRAVSNRVAYVPGTAFYADGFGSHSMRLSYCYPTSERIREGVRRLAQVVEQESELRTTFGSVAASDRPGLDAPAPNQS
jgi:DNA-binding transcriptional MocR family regulator